MQTMHFIGIIAVILTFCKASFALNFAFVASHPELAIQTDEGIAKAVNVEGEDKIVVSIQSEPTGTKVYINKKYCGLAPFPLGAPQRCKRRVGVVKKNNDKWNRERSLSEDTIIIARLEPISKAVKKQRKKRKRRKVAVTINSNPSGAKVTIQVGGKSKYMGKTPVRFKAPAGYQFTVSISKDGYKTWQEKIRFDRKPNLVANLKGKSRKWPWVIGTLAAAGGGVAYFLLKGAPESTQPSATSWPNPPGRP